VLSKTKELLSLIFEIKTKIGINLGSIEQQSQKAMFTNSMLYRAAISKASTVPSYLPQWRTHSAIYPWIKSACS
jgi:hypothetical protein